VAMTVQSVFLAIAVVFALVGANPTQSAFRYSLIVILSLATGSQNANAGKLAVPDLAGEAGQRAARVPSSIRRLRASWAGELAHSLPHAIRLASGEREQAPVQSVRPQSSIQRQARAGRSHLMTMGCSRTRSSSANAWSGSLTLMVRMPRARAGLRLTPRSSRNTDSSGFTPIVAQASS